MTTQQKAATPAKFKWTADNRATVAEAYNAQVALDHAVANSEKFLDSLAATVGAKNGRSVRSMLATEKMYKTLDVPKAPAPSNRISKGQIVRSIAKGLNLDLEVVQSLDKANSEALTVLVSAINETRAAANLPEIEIK